MISKRSRRLILYVLLLVAILAAILFLFNPLRPNRFDLVQLRMDLAEMAKPTIVKHTAIVPSVTIIDYPKPVLVVDDKILQDLNCPLEEPGGRYCFEIRDQGQSKSQGCMAIYTPDSLLGGLQPSYPIAECSSGEGRYVYQRGGCLVTVGITYIIERQGKYEKIESRSELKSIYAPIESETEALSYAIAATGYSALYGKEIREETEYFVEELENTHVEVRGDEYIVRLFDYSLCGCRQHQTTAIDVAVDRKGNIREVYREEVYRDAIEICID